MVVLVGDGTVHFGEPTLLICLDLPPWLQLLSIWSSFSAYFSPPLQEGLHHSYSVL